MTRPLRLVADDLTGALDAAAPFATPESPIEVPWPCRPRPTSLRVAATSESRNGTREEAIARTLSTFRRLDGGVPGTLWFKKVDSVLRGHPIAETAALVREGNFRRALFAPAFPEMGRITRRRRQVLLAPDGERHVGPSDLVTAFEKEGLTAAVADGSVHPSAVVMIVEATSAEQLAEAVQVYGSCADLLWVGSRGLAAALSGPSPLRRTPRIGGIVVGTSHPVTRGQVETIGGRITRANPGRPSVIDAAKPILIDPVPECASAAETRASLLTAIGQLEAGADPEDALVVVGGDTLSTVLDATGTSGLDVLGEVQPGIPLVGVRGGRWAGRRMVTKSGGFGQPDLLLDLLKHHGHAHP